MRLSVIILAHNQLAMTRQCLRALAAAITGTEHEVFCVDNGSVEDLAALADEGSRFQRFGLVRNGRNDTFSVANNRAARSAGGEWLLFLNNDVTVRPDCITALLAFADRHPEAGVCGGRLIYPDGMRLQHAGMEQMLWGVVSNYGVGAAVSDGRFRVDAERFAVTGAMLCIRRELFEKVGGFGEEYSWGYEDVDLCLKARARSFRVYYVAGAEGVHHESATLNSRRRVADVDRNYRAYRRRWDPILTPAERRYLHELVRTGMRRVVVFGTGAAGQALCRTLQRGDVEVAAFTATAPDVAEVCGRPVVALSHLARLSYDRLVVGSQFFFEVEKGLRRYDPQGDPVFPRVA